MMGVNDSAPVLTIDGPGGSGKGTVSKIVAKQLGWNYLDSGTVYRALGIAAIDHHVDLSNEKALVKLAENINLEFKFNGDWAVLLDGEEIQQQLQTEEIGNIASKIAVFPTVRQRLLAKQLLFQKPPGLVADGRDMGTVVFPSAKYKVYLTASAEERGKRRYKQLIEKGISANLRDVIQDVEKRDKRDKTRTASPLTVPDGAVYIDSSFYTIEEVVQQILDSLKTSKSRY